jgi:hypothetical protein
MAGASILRNLSDADLDAVHHMIRRDAMTDLAIARWAEKRLQEALGDAEGALGNDQAAIMVVARYRASQPYRDWLKRWLEQDLDLKNTIDKTKASLELVKDLVGTGSTTDGIDQASRVLQARLLVFAQSMSDQDLAEASGKSGWIRNLIKMSQDQSKMEQKRAGQSVKTAIEDAVAASDDQTKERFKAVVATVDKVMGLA